LDGHPVHKSKAVKVFIAIDGKLRLFILPPFSPNLNPDESVRNWLKKQNLGNVNVTVPDLFRETVQTFYATIIKN